MPMAPSSAFVARAERADERVVVRLDGAVIVEADDVAIAKELRGGADPGQAAIARVSRAARRVPRSVAGRRRCRRSVRSGRVGPDRRPRRRIARTRGARTRGRSRRVRIAPCVVEPRSRRAGKSSRVAPRPAAPSVCIKAGPPNRAVVSETTSLRSAAGTSLWRRTAKCGDLTTAAYVGFPEVAEGFERDGANRTSRLWGHSEAVIPEK